MTQADTGLPDRLISGPPGFVPFLIQLQPQPSGVAADPSTDGRGMLADARSEHQRVQATQCRNQRSQFSSDAIDE
jgi:hypothetical protein